MLFVEVAVKQFLLAADVDDVFHLLFAEVEVFGGVDDEFVVHLHVVALHAVGFVEKVEIDEQAVGAAQAAQALDAQVVERVCCETEVVESFFDSCHGGWFIRLFVDTFIRLFVEGLMR